MAPEQSGDGWDNPSDGPDFDTIDLTFSSPEPEDRRSRPPQRQQQLPQFLKKEPRSDYAQQHESNFVARHVQQVRPINPQHIAQIINTSDSQALRAVLIDLCKMSPALSGALARGLARQSTFARGLVNQRRSATQASASKSVKREQPDEIDSYERMKLRLANKSASQGVRSPSNFAKKIHATSVLPGPRVKHEPRTEDSSSDFDRDLNMPGSLPSTARKSQSFRSALHDTSVSNVAQQPISLSQRFASTPYSSKVKPESMVCSQCHDTYTDDTETCFYHSGPQIMINGVVSCSDCASPSISVGCAIGMHVSEADGGNDPGKYKQNGGTQTPSKQTRFY
jgi:hypothetical protein